MVTNPVKGILFKLLCLILSAILTLAFAHRSPSIGILEQIFITSCGATVTLVGLALFCGMRKEIRIVGQKRWYWLRAILSILAMTTWSYTAKSLGPSEATLLSYLIPISTLVIAAACGLERMHMSCVLGIAICFGAIFLSLGDGIQAQFFNLMIGIFTSVCWGAYDVVCKKQASTEHFLAQGIFVFGYSTLIMTPFVIGGLMSTPAEEIIFSCLLSLLRVGIIVTMFLSYKYLTVNNLMLLSYLRLPIMVGANYAIFSASPRIASLVAAVVIVATNIMIIAYNKKVQKIL